MKKLTYVFLSLIVFTSCKERVATESIVYFDTPQPVNDSELKSFPSKFLGQYVDEHNNTLVILDDLIVMESLYTNAIHKSELDSIKEPYSLKNGKLILHKSNQVYTVTEHKDSIYLSQISKDTLFAFSPSQKAKRINGHVVLNYKDSTFWNINLLSIEKDSLRWKYIGNKSDYTNLKQVVKDIEASDDTTFIHVRPNRKEFKKMLALKNYGIDIKYLKKKK
jgi:hypothetical protein